MSTLQEHSPLPDGLPDGRELVERGRELARGIKLGVSLLCEAHGVATEGQYKEQMSREGRLMTTMNIGLQTWSDTARALEMVHRESERRGFRIDRYQMQMDRRMGVPREARARAAKETGPMLDSDADWRGTTGTVPIQPGLGDMMIGSPMSVENATKALEVGVSYIGNMSQFNWKFPGYRGTDIDQMCEMVTALGIMAEKAQDGAVVQSYLDDGFPAQFGDYSSYIGWALFERYLVEDVLGGRLSIAYGGLTRDPITKTAVILALEATKPDSMCNSFYHCNTTAYSTLVDRNYGLLGVDMLLLLATQVHTGSGAAVLPIPVTEALRIPSWQEIVEVHTITRRIADEAPAVAEIIDWSGLEARRDQLVAGGREFLDNLLNGLTDLGVDIEDPLALLLAVRRLGAPAIEKQFGCGSPDQEAPRGYRPLIPTDTLLDFVAEQTATKEHIERHSLTLPTGERVVIASTDVHEFALELLVDAVRNLGVEPVVAGTSVDPDELADLALEAGASMLLVSTHNGMALTYAQQLLKELSQRRLELRILFGGTLNQDVEDSDTPIDVRDELTELGIKVCQRVADLSVGLGLES